MERSSVNTAFYKGRLSTESIRILTILPGELNAPLHCTLRDHTLQEEPRYDAISYSWGSGQLMERITVNGEPGFEVSEHLCACLRRLRHLKDDSPVWIDALCTNQKDEEEKKQHLERSRRVFLKAQQTLIWLGEPYGENSATADEQTCEAPISRPLALDQADQGILKTLEAILDKGRHSASPSRVWWKRLWCLHEFAVSTTEPIVLVGPYRLKWALFAQLAGDVLDPLFQYLNETRANRAHGSCKIDLFNLRVLTADRFSCTDDGDRDDALKSILQLYKLDERGS